MGENKLEQKQEGQAWAESSGAKEVVGYYEVGVRENHMVANKQGYWMSG